MKHSLSIFFSLLLYFNKISAISLNEITYESLKTNAYTDHVEVFHHLFTKISISKMIEFGLGLGTKFFIEHVPYVVSIEIVNQDQSTIWFDDCCELYKSYSSWTPHLYHGSSYLTKTNQIAIQTQNSLLDDPQYLQEIREIVESHIDSTYELAFVDPGIRNRGDIVNSLFNHIDIIAAHDTNFIPEVYGWNRIQTPENYAKISFVAGMGITFWIKRTRGDLIDALLYAKQFVR